MEYRTHNPICGVAGRSVGGGDEGRGVGRAPVEAGHGRQAGADVRRRHWMWRVVLHDKHEQQQPCGEELTGVRTGTALNVQVGSGTIRRGARYLPGVRESAGCCSFRTGAYEMKILPVFRRKQAGWFRWTSSRGRTHCGLHLIDGREIQQSQKISFKYCQGDLTTVMV